MPTEEPDDWFWATARRFRPIHGLAAAGLACMIFCCGPCMMLRSCTSSNSDPLRDEIATLAVLPESIETEAIQEAQERPKSRASLKDFAYEDRILAERIKISEWDLVSTDTQLMVITYYSLSRYPQDGPMKGTCRNVYYMDSVKGVAEMPALRDYPLMRLFDALEPEFEKMFSQMRMNGKPIPDTQ